MKKTLLICLMGYLCLYGSTKAQSEVAESPPDKDLVYQSGIPGQEGDSSSVPSGALIYGEIINPDSLGTLTLDYRTGLLPLGQSLLDSTIQIYLSHGAFFDGVLDPRVQKFQTQVPIDKEFAQINLKIGQRTILKNILVFPGDSIKVGIDLQDFSLVFAGPQRNWFEAQYALQRAQKTNMFSEPRLLLEINREQLLKQQDYRLQMEHQDSVFGSRIAIYEFGKDGLDHEYSLLMDSSLYAIPGWQTLQPFLSVIPEERFRLLESQLIGSYYAEHLSTFRKYHHGMPLALGNSLSANRAKALIPEILSKLEKELIIALDKGISPGVLDLAREWVYTDNIVEEESLEELIVSKFYSPVKERLLYSALLHQVETTQPSPEKWQVYADYLAESTVEKDFNKLKSSLEPGNFLIPGTFYDLKGKEIDLNDLYGKSSLLYFYFSSCTHSANYFRNYLHPFYREMGDSLGLQVIAVSVDNDPELWKSQLSTYSSADILNLNLPSREAADWLKKYRVQGYPRSMLLNKEGRVLSYILDGEDYADFSSNILFLLKNQHLNENQMIH